MAASADANQLRITEDHDDSLLYIDASAMVKHANHAKGGGAHSDIYTSRMARLIAELLQRYAPGVKAERRYSGNGPLSASQAMHDSSSSSG